MIYWELAAGLALLIVGGDILVRGSVDLARHLGVSPLLIGLTLVGFGTSAPELVASVQAALVGSPGIAVGNVVGSNIANVFLILGCAALLSPVQTPRAGFRRDGGMVVISTLICLAIVLLGYLDRTAGYGMLALLLVYIVYTYARERVTPATDAGDGTEPMRASFAILLTLGGLALVIVGARLLVFSSIDLATAAGISETIVGLTVVAVGTSLPELVTSVMAAIRKQSAVAFGNVLGSNIYNVLGILGVTAIVEPIDVPVEIARFDIWVMVGSVLLLVMFAISNWRISRREGFVLLAGYAAYVGYLASIA
jgi:cation:H+ antiporter